MEEERNKADLKQASLRTYTSKVLTESSLSAISDILSTESTRRKLFKTFVFLFCLTGFFYQGITFLGYVFEYPTIVDIDIENPDMIEMPAFTFCNNNGISRVKFCKKYPVRCTLASEEFCLKYPQRCPSNETYVPKTEYYGLINNISLEDYLSIGPDLDSFLLERTNEMAINYPLYGPHIRAKSLSGEGRMGCYSVHSLIDSPDYPVQVDQNEFLKTPVTTFKFDVEEDDEFIPSRKSGMLFSIHSPYVSVNPAEKGIFMEPGKTYKIYFKMDKEVLLPYPFETDCLNYTEEWLSRNKTGIRMQEMCKHKCALDVTEKYWNCSFFFILYPNSLRSCEDIRDTLELSNESMEEESEICSDNCKDDCSKIKYSRTVQEGFTADLLWEGHNGEDKKLILVEVYLDDSEIITFRHRPQYLFVEVFSSIGGFVGVWLGISLVELTNFFESLFRILIFSFKRRRAEKVIVM